MTMTGLDAFDTTLQKTNELLKTIEEEYRWENRRNQSHAIVRAVLIALRDRLTVEDAAHFGAQLTTLLRGIFYEQWKPAIVPVKMRKEEFLERVFQLFGAFSIEGKFEDLTAFTLNAIMEHISPGEVEKLKTELPHDIREMIS